jgi:hypothetical protein
VRGRVSHNLNFASTGRAPIISAVRIQMETLAYLGVFVLVAYSGYVVWLLWRAVEYTKAQRIAQISIVALLPGLGAILCHLVLRGLRKSEKRPDSNFVPQKDLAESPPSLGD